MLITAPQVITAAGPPGDPAAAAAEVLQPGFVVIAGGLVTAVGRGRPPRHPDIALTSGLLTPGFVDLQVNGYFGVELRTAGDTGWSTVTRRLPETGTTAFLPTFITAPLPDLAAALRSAAARLRPRPGGARVLGVHLEGPFIACSRRGAHNEAWITAPTERSVAELIGAAGGALRLITLAPEVESGLAAVGWLTAAGVVVSVGHSDATAAQVAAAASAGARMVTHLFNAQRPLHHREPGVVGQALTDPRLVCGLIGDLQHVGAAACLIAFRTAPGRICLVTDAAPCAGMPPGRYLLDGEPVELPPGAGQAPVRADGGFAGSGLRMDAALANMVSLGVSRATAVTAATRVPADLIGRPDLGRLTPGAAADLVWLDDDLKTRATWIGGEQVYERAAEPRAGQGWPR